MYQRRWVICISERVVVHKDEEALWLNNEPIEHYFSRAEIELEATPLPKPGQEMYLF